MAVGREVFPFPVGCDECTSLNEESGVLLLLVTGRMVVLLHRKLHFTHFVANEQKRCGKFAQIV